MKITLKLTTYLFLMAFAFSSCSSDDDNEAVVLTNKEKLVLGSPWNISNVTILQIYGEHTTPEDQLNTQNNSAYLESEMKLTFNNNNTGVLNTSFPSSTNFNYSMVGSDTGQNGFNMNINDNDGTFTMLNCTVTQTQFTFEQNIWVSDGGGFEDPEVEVLARFTFDKGN